GRPRRTRRHRPSPWYRRRKPPPRRPHPAGGPGPSRLRSDRSTTCIASGTPWVRDGAGRRRYPNDVRTEGNSTTPDKIIQAVSHHEPPVEMPSGMTEDRHHHNQPHEQRDRAQHQPDGDDQAPKDDRARVGHGGTDRGFYGGVEAGVAVEQQRK